MRGHVVAGKYELQRELGHGGMGSVWAALDRTLARVVALKFMSPEHLESEDSRRRFAREAQAMAKISNEHIVSVYEYGMFEDTPFIAMELLEGEDLETRIRRQHRLTPEEVLSVIKQVGKALTAATTVGMVHRDLKPSNLFISRGASGETVKILDFGLAWLWAGGSRISSPNKVLGTPAYMSPEQLRGSNAHHSGDLWSLAVTAYRALTGQFPFPGSTLGDLVVSICTDRCRPPSSHVPGLPIGLDAFFETALAKEKDARFQSARDFIESFEAQCAAQETTRILVVDDEVSVHELMKLRFRKQIEEGAYIFTFASSGATALDELSHNAAIDVILADINMPEMDGLTLLGHIPAVAPFASTIMVTAYDDMANIRRAMNRGAFDFLVKPIRFADLDSTITKTAGLVRDRRKHAAADMQNRMLRQFTNPATVARLGRHEPEVALASDGYEATVVHVAVSPPTQVEKANIPDAVRRAINSLFEVIIPEFLAHDGNIDMLQGSGLLAVFTGAKHVARALRSCVRLNAQIAALARLAGEESPYARGLKIGISSGRVLSACFGSHAYGRLNYTVAGETVEIATRLSALALPHEILAYLNLLSPDTSEQIWLQPIATRHTPIFTYGPIYQVIGPHTADDGPRESILTATLNTDEHATLLTDEHAF